MHTLHKTTKNNIYSIFICLFIFIVPNFAIANPSVFIDGFCWAISLSLAGVALRILSPQLTNLYLLFFVLSALIIGVGFLESASVLLWIISSWSLGNLIINKTKVKENVYAIKYTEAIVIGAAMWLAIWGVAMHFPVNYQKTHFVFCLLPCIIFFGQWSSIRSDLRSKAYSAQVWINSIPLWSWIIGLTIIGWVLRWTSFPSMGYDDHALHLRVWTRLLTHHYYDFDINAQIWSVAPFAVDLLHAGLSLIAGHDTRGAMNLLLAALILLLTRKILSLWKLPSWVQWLLMILMASTPMLGNLLLSLQTELALAVLAMTGIRLLIGCNDDLNGQHVLAMFACAALCAATKLPGAVLGATLIIALAFCLWLEGKILNFSFYSHFLSCSTLFLLIPLGFVALHSYVLAWILTGNPVFPLYNAIFLSEYFHQINFSDVRWIHGFSLVNYFKAFFYTSEFFESENFTAGWQYLFLLPITIIAGLRSSAPNTLRVALIPLFGFGLLMFSATQYWRYLFPVMPVASILFASLFIETKLIYQRLFATLIIACIALNLFFFTKISWMMSLPVPNKFKNNSSQGLVSIHAPAALLTERINRYNPNSRVLYPTYTPYGATLHGTPLYVNWYSPLRSTNFSAIKTREDVKNFLSRENPDFVISDISDKSASHLPPSLLREHLAEFGTAVAKEGSFILYRLGKIPLIYKKEFELSSYLEKEHPKETHLPLAISKESVHASQEPKKLTDIKTYSTKQARYSIEFNCPSEVGFFIAQINWSKGDPYYRLIPCTPEKSLFSEAIPIPVGAISGTVYITARDTESINIKNLSVELH